MTPPVGFINPYPLRSDESRKPFLEARVAACRTLVEAAFEYLTFDDRAFLRDIENPPVPVPFERPKPTIEYLIYAQKQRENVQAQLDQMEAALDNESVPEAQAAIVEAALGMPLRTQLARLDEEISEIQKSLEEVKD